MKNFKQKRKMNGSSVNLGAVRVCMASIINMLKKGVDYE